MTSSTVTCQQQQQKHVKKASKNKRFTGTTDTFQVGICRCFPRQGTCGTVAHTLECPKPGLELGREPGRGSRLKVL